jgi:hypothetical protein
MRGASKSKDRTKKEEPKKVVESKGESKFEKHETRGASNTKKKVHDKPKKEVIQ